MNNFAEVIETGVEAMTLGCSERHRSRCKGQMSAGAYFSKRASTSEPSILVGSERKRGAQLVNCCTRRGKCCRLVAAEIVRRRFHVGDGFLEILNGLCNSRMRLGFAPDVLRIGDRRSLRSEQQAGG